MFEKFAANSVYDVQNLQPPLSPRTLHIYRWHMSCNVIGISAFTSLDFPKAPLDRTQY